MSTVASSGDPAARRQASPSSRLTPLEIASGLVFGFTTPEPVPPLIGVATPVGALERAILPALRRPPCLMSFSGGRASSAILAVAVHLARREGLELPVPVTSRFDHAADAEETARQERVIVHLGLTDWLRLDSGDELDLVGPVALRVLRRHGLLWPFHAHFSMPLIEWASGGSLITGLGDRNVLGEPGSLLCREPGPLPWLQPAAHLEVSSCWAADAASRPTGLEHRLVWWRRLRQVQIAIDCLRELGKELRVEMCHPFIDPAFSTALSEIPIHRRTTSDIFGKLLPCELLTLRSPSTRENAFWGRHSSRLVDDWDGEGVDVDLVDVDALRLRWSLPRPDPRTFLLLQSVALERASVTAAVAGT